MKTRKELRDQLVKTLQPYIDLVESKLFDKSEHIEERRKFHQDYMTFLRELCERDDFDLKLIEEIKRHITIKPNE